MTVHRGRRSLKRRQNGKSLPPSRLSSPPRVSTFPRPKGRDRTSSTPIPRSRSSGWTGAVTWCFSRRPSATRGFRATRGQRREAGGACVCHQLSEAARQGGPGHSRRGAGVRQRTTPRRGDLARHFARRGHPPRHRRAPRSTSPLRATLPTGRSCRLRRHRHTCLLPHPPPRRSRLRASSRR